MVVIKQGMQNFLMYNIEETFCSAWYSRQALTFLGSHANALLYE